MQRKQGFPIANCSIKMPDSSNVPMEGILEEEEPLQRRQQLINFGHAQWGFNNWNWSVTKQDLDFVELSNGKYTAGVVAFVSVKVKTLDIHRENIGYATSLAPNKGAAIHRARKCAVTNALRETLLSFGGTVATELVELLDARRPEPAEPPGESNANALNRLAEPRNSPQAGARKEPAPPCVAVKSASIPPVAKAHPMPANLPPAANRAPPANAPRPPPPPPAAAPVPAPPRPGSNVKSEALTEEEVRAERKRRQKLAQEEFRLKHLLKQKDTDENQDINKNCSLDTLLMAIPSQEIVVEGTEKIVNGKRKSPMSDGSNKRRNFLNTLTNT
ncbi:DNA repair protein RAD52 homolog isoform X3 [Nymphalis io]|uniref:DNA repair protein RAD52 homolog isoform X3 n=1 Tax=Inachis io TaxID=171585 RepID=UPI00216A3DD5|nr:DNA repair protein RAD52 homolog isoform X3 [Nymphalis io]